MPKWEVETKWNVFDPYLGTHLDNVKVMKPVIADTEEEAVSFARKYVMKRGLKVLVTGHATMVGDRDV